MKNMKSNKEIEAKNKANIKKSYDLKKSFKIQINRYNDLHFLKKHLLASAKFSNIFQCEDLNMRFEKDRIIIEKAKKESER